MTSLVAFRDCATSDYERFYEEFLQGNNPCVLSSECTQHWSSRCDWVLPEGSLDYAFLKTRFGEADVPLTRNDGRSDYSIAAHTTSTFEQYLNHLQMDVPLFDPDTVEETIWYLKDWHFQRTFPDYQAYEVPLFFSSDWLNESCDARYPHEPDKDYRFLYLGPKGSWTPFHEDVLQSFSWSANISGFKKWLIFPPGEERKLVQQNGLLPADVTRVDLTCCTYFTHVQKPGEVMFIPSKWHHQVQNLETTLSLNHNWINAANAFSLWELLKSSLQKVTEEINDCAASFATVDEWNDQCQLLLKADLGMNFSEFLDMLLLIGTRRRNYLKNDSDAVHEFVWKKDISCIKEIFRQIGSRNDEFGLKGALVDAIRMFLEFDAQTESETV